MPFEGHFDTLNGLLLILWGIYKDMFKRSIQAIKWVLYDMFSCVEVRAGNKINNKDCLTCRVEVLPRISKIDFQFGKIDYIQC